MWTLKAIRVNKNWSIQEASRRYGISVDSLRNYETYRTRPNAKIINDILKATDMKYEDVIFFKNSEPRNCNFSNSRHGGVYE